MEAVSNLVELGTEGLPISLQLDDRLHLDLQVADGGLRAGGLGIEGPVGVLEDGVFLISGEAASVAGDDWLQFL